MQELGKLFLLIVNMSLTAGMLVPIVLIARVLLSKAPKSFSYALWGIVGFRLVCPISFSSVFSVFSVPFVKEHAVMKQVAVSSKGALSAQMMSVPSTFSGTVQKVGAATGSSWGVLKIAAVIWVIGIVSLLMYEMVSWIKLKKQLCQAVKYDGCIYECDQISTPFVLGILNPRIYIPFHLSEEERNYVLLHEQYHLERRDYLVKFLAVVLLTIYWFQPLIWIAFWGMSKDMEMSCDEKVLLELGDTVKTDYSDSLLAFAVGKKVPVVSPLAFGESSVKSRIKNVLRFQKCRKIAMVGALLVCVVVTICGITNEKQIVEPVTEENRQDVSELAKELFAAKTPYIGNASAVGKLLQTLEVGSFGNYTMELQTSEEPYILKINFEQEPVDAEQFNIEMHNHAVVLLALIENAGEVQWIYPIHDSGDLYVWSCDLESANAILQTEDAKKFAESEGAVQELLNKVGIFTQWQMKEKVVRTEDGYCTPDGEIYQHRLVLTGRHPNAASDSTCVVYTNEADLTFKDVSEYIFSSQSPEKRTHKMYVRYVASPDYIESQKNK